MSLLKLAFVLECLDDFKNLARLHIQTPQSIDELLLSKTASQTRFQKMKITQIQRLKVFLDDYERTVHRGARPLFS